MELPRQLVLKIASRCNIACSYCYMYFRGDESYLKSSKIIDISTIRILAQRIKDYEEKFALGHIIVTFHGGEPLIVGKKYFELIVKTLIETCGRDKLGFTVQTNGILFDEEWAKLFIKYDINIGFSLDGPAEANDVSRVDHQGRGTYDRVAKSIGIANEWGAQGLKFRGIISVIEPSVPARRYYDHMVNSIKVNDLNILLPDADHDTYDKYVRNSPTEFGEYLIDLFDAWWVDFPRVRIRFFEDISRSILGGQATTDLVGTGECKSIIVGTDGELEEHDVARINGNKQDSNLNIKDNSIEDIFQSQRFIS